MRALSQLVKFAEKLVGSFQINLGEALALTIGFFMAVGALINALPSFWIIPKIGPFQGEYLRAVMMAFGVSVVVFSTGFAQLSLSRDKKYFSLALIFDAVLILTAVGIAWDFAVTTIQIQEGLFFFEEYHAWITFVGICIFTLLCWRIWGMPLAIFAIIMVAYYFTGQHLPSLLSIRPMEFIENFPEDMWYNLNKGVIGLIFEIVIFTVFPFIIFGTMLEATGVGASLIRFAFSLTKNTRGGPAHAAVLASSLFGTMSGVPVANVVGTGVLTIPLIKRRGFTPTFAGAVEATASTGGQIMPPIMGAAALIMADTLQISYLVVITAALMPALFYYASLFFTVTFEARRLDIKTGEIGEEMAVTRDDVINLLVLFAAVMVIITVLLNGYSASAAGVLVVLFLLPAGFFCKEVRARPVNLVIGMAKGGTQFSKLLMAIGVVGVVLGVLSSTGLPFRLANAIEILMGHSLLIALIVTAITAIVFGMGMPTLPAYLTIILILGPTLTKLGLSLLVAHMFVFYFGCASSITPPVALAAYAGASIAGAGPMRTGLLALRIGAAMFIVPFVFAFYPDLLLVEEVGGFEWGVLISISLRLLLCLWLLASAFSGYDARKIEWPEIVLRLALAAAVLYTDTLISTGAVVLGVALIGYNYILARRSVAASTA